MKGIRNLITSTLLFLAAASFGGTNAHADTYSWTNLQSDIAGVAQHVDPNLVNPWTYPNGKDNWCKLTNGYYYNLQVYPPGTASNPTTSVRVVATGRRSMSSTDDMPNISP